MRQLLSAFLLVVLVPGPVRADDAAPDSAEPPLTAILNDLASVDFGTRQTAQRKLDSLTAAQIETLPALITSLPSPEAAVRCTASLQQHFLSSDAKVVAAAWEALETLKSSERGMVRDEASWILSSRWTTRQQLTVEELSKHGALVLLPETMAAAQEVRQYRSTKEELGNAVRRIRGGLFVPPPITSAQIFITDEWTGNLEALQLLLRLPGLQMNNNPGFGANAGGGRAIGRGNAGDPTPVAVFLVAGHPLPDEHTEWLKASFGNRIQDRGLVMLGITSNSAVAGTGCPVNTVVPFGSGDAAGVRAGDRIQKVNSEEVSSFDDLVENLRQHSSGETVQLTLERVDFDGIRPQSNSFIMTLEVTLRSWADYVKAIHRTAAERDSLPVEKQQ